MSFVSLMDSGCELITLINSLKPCIFVSLFFTLTGKWELNTEFRDSGPFSWESLAVIPPPSFQFGRRKA